MYQNIPLSKLTGASAEMTLGDSVYRMSPLRDVDYGELENWVMSQHSTRPALGSPDSLAIAASREGVVRMIWLGIRRNHPKVALEEIAEALADTDAMRSAAATFDQLNGTSADGGSSDEKSDDKPADRALIYKMLGEMFGWSPQTIGEMTPLQQMAMLGPGGKRHTVTHQVDSLTEAFERLRERRKAAAGQTK
jgi:hypothetical protein